MASNFFSWRNSNQNTNDPHDQLSFAGPTNDYIAFVFDSTFLKYWFCVTFHSVLEHVTTLHIVSFHFKWKSWLQLLICRIIDLSYWKKIHSATSYWTRITLLQIEEICQRLEPLGYGKQAGTVAFKNCILNPTNFQIELLRDSTDPIVISERIRMFFDTVMTNEKVRSFISHQSKVNRFWAIRDHSIINRSFHFDFTTSFWERSSIEKATGQPIEC